MIVVTPHLQCTHMPMILPLGRISQILLSGLQLGSRSMPSGIIKVSIKKGCLCFQVERTCFNELQSFIIHCLSGRDTHPIVLDYACR